MTRLTLVLAVATACVGASHGLRSSGRPLSRSAVRSAARMVAAPPKARGAGEMFCYQCEQTEHGEGCTSVGVCGKSAETAALQDLLVHQLKGLAAWALHAKETASVPLGPSASFFRAALFSTLTNVNFDAQRFVGYISEADDRLAQLKRAVAAAGAPPLRGADVPWFPRALHPHEWDASGVPRTAEALAAAGHAVGIAARRSACDATLVGLQELVAYGAKGAAAYAHHAALAGIDDLAATEEVMRAFAFLCAPEAGEVPAVLERALGVGAANLAIMGSLEKAHTDAFGVPSPAAVRMGPVRGRAILVSGHDLPDLKALLEQTAGTGINVYTHGEMLPAHGYPELRKFAHLAGHYGGAWYRQKFDFATFPGAILMTTNCVLEPPEGSYAPNLFTTGETGVAGVRHVPNREFGAVIARALELDGFTAQDEAAADALRTHTVGFGREATLGAAPALLEAIGEGKVKHIFLIGGCDGAEGARKYYKKVGEALPDSSMVLTLGCAKFRVIGQDFGTVPGTELPRLLDMGQCNDAYAAVQVAIALAEATGSASVNDLPLSLDLSWFEQKAVAVLLTLLHLGVRDIRLGPALPAFLTPAAVQVLVDAYNLTPADLKHPEEDLARMLQKGH